MRRRIAPLSHRAISAPQRDDERGVVSFELLWSLILLVVLIPGLTLYFTNLTRTTKYLSDTHQSTLINLKTFAALTSALSALERNRLECAATIVSGSSLALPSGGAHPLASLTGTSVPRVDSDILTVIDLAPSYRGKVSSLNSVGSSIDASVCGASKRPSPGTFKSYLLYTLEGALQMAGDSASSSSGCYQVSGTMIQGVVSQTTTLASSLHEVAPIDREYSLFVDRSGNLRLASHVGSRITENQPITRGLRSISLRAAALGGGVKSFSVTITPSVGRSFQGNITPALARRSIWSEVLP